MAGRTGDIRHQGSSRLDAVLQVHQACHSFCPISSGHLAVARLDPLWLVPRHHQSLRYGYAERGTCTFPFQPYLLTDRSPAIETLVQDILDLLWLSRFLDTSLCRRGTVFLVGIQTDLLLIADNLGQPRRSGC